MKWSDLQWKATYAGAQQARLRFGNEYTLSIDTEINEPDLFELAILSGELFVTLPGINQSDDEIFDDVLRFQTREEVVGVIRKLESITGEQPKGVVE